METMVKQNQRKNSSKKDDQARMTFQLPDLRQVTVLSKADWQRIQREMDPDDREQESVIEEARQRKVLHLQSVEVVKQWSNTISGQRQKQLEAKRIRDEIEEEKRKLTDKEEAKYREQKRKEAIERAKTQLYYQTDPVRGLHRALLLTEVMKEREAQIELKQRIKNTSKDVDKYFTDVLKARQDEALRKEEEKAQEKKMESRAVAEGLRQQIKENEMARERQKLENKRDGEEIQRLKELYQWEKRKEKESREKQKRDLMQAHLEHLASRDVIRVTEAEKQKAEEEQRKLFLSAKEKMMTLRKEREMELNREAQMRRESIANLTAAQQEETVGEEQRIAKAVAEQDAKQVQQQWEEEEKRATTMKAIAAHREFTIQEKERRDKMEKQKARDELEAKREAERIFSEKQQLKDQQSREERRKLQAFNVTQMAEKSARRRQLRRAEHEFEKVNTELATAEAKQFHQYSQHVINAAAEGQRNLVPLYKAVREGFRGGFDPISSRARPTCTAQDHNGAQVSQYVSNISQNFQKLNQAVDIQAEKKRLGFTW